MMRILIYFYNKYQLKIFKITKTACIAGIVNYFLHYLFNERMNTYQ